MAAAAVMAAGPGGKGGKGGAPEKINAQFSEMPAGNCIGAGRLEGWFATPAYLADGRGWGHIQSFCFEGELFFHLQRSPSLRGINFDKKDEVTFEVVEIDGRVQAVKLLLPHQVQDEKQRAGAGDSAEGKPQPKELIGQHVEGYVNSQCQLVQKQNWGFVSSDAFAGKVFWHITENPDMQNVPFEREDLVEFDICLDDQRGGQVRAKHMKWVGPSDKRIRGQKLTEKKLAKREAWKNNWRVGPPPDWDCSQCGFSNFGRNKACKQCGVGERPKREEWAPETDQQKAEAVAKGLWAGPDGGGVPQAALEAAAPVTVPPRAFAPAPAGQAAAPMVVPRKQMPPQPAGIFSHPKESSVQWSLAMCMSRFLELTQQEGAHAGQVRALINEINGQLGDDRSAKRSFSMELAKNPWFATNGQEVRYKPGSNTIEISPTPQFATLKRTADTAGFS